MVKTQDTVKPEKWRGQWKGWIYEFSDSGYPKKVQKNALLERDSVNWMINILEKAYFRHIIEMDENDEFGYLWAHQPNIQVKRIPFSVLCNF